MATILATKIVEPMATTLTATLALVLAVALLIALTTVVAVNNLTTLAAVSSRRHWESPQNGSGEAAGTITSDNTCDGIKCVTANATDAWDTCLRNDATPYIYTLLDESAYAKAIT